jgi:hypothetical protein
MSELSQHFPGIVVNPFYTPGRPEFGPSVHYDRMLLVAMAHFIFEGSKVATCAEMFPSLPTEAELIEPAKKELDTIN